jgi:hypothetical protein
MAEVFLSRGIVLDDRLIINVFSAGIYISAKSYVPSSGRIYLPAIAAEGFEPTGPAKKIAQAAPQLWRAQNFLQRCDILPRLANPAIGFFKAAQASVNVADNAGGGEPFSQALLRPLQNLGVFFEPFGHMAENLTQLLLNDSRIVVQDLTELNAQLIESLLHEQQRRILRFFLQHRFEAAKKDPTSKNKAEKEKQKE